MAQEHADYWSTVVRTEEQEPAMNKSMPMPDVVHAAALLDSHGRIQMEFHNDDDEDEDEQFLLFGKCAPDNAMPVAPVTATVPKMNICIMIVGTRGDVQPFVGIALRLQRDGHRVRLATHAVYRELVVSHGVEFYPLGGDPKELAAYMVKTGGHLIPQNLEAITKDVPRNMLMIEEILQSTWPAVSAPDPMGGGTNSEGHPIAGAPFQAHAIISNPVTYGHIHVAERLGVPLHIMFPQPWVPTVAFPHPLSNLPYNNRPRRTNFISYKMVDLLMWQGTEAMVNQFRTQVLGLRKIRKGDGGRDILLDLAIPHAFMWSPALVPKPADWGAIYDVVGTVQLKEERSTYAPAPELEGFLGADHGPIFVGFGSMVIADPAAMSRMIIDAASRAGVRVLIQSSWSDMSDGIDVPSNIYFLGNCPHDWLMPRVSAVVHHGGAGTTAAGLLAGKPTFIVPFFGDQPFWGRAVVNAGVGVEPCPIKKLTVDTLCKAFVRMSQPDIRERAVALGATMRREDGVENAVACFYHHLPLHQMRCDIDGERLATRWSEKDKIKLCEECKLVIVSRPENAASDIVEYHCVDYSARGPDSILDGAVSGTGALLHELGSGVKSVFTEPARGFREDGAKGAVIGVGKGVGTFFYSHFKGAALFADHVATGHYNENRAPDDRKQASYLLNHKALHVFSNSTIPEAHTANMTPDERIARKHRGEQEKEVAIQVTPDERRRLEARFHAILKERQAAEGEKRAVHSDLTTEGGSAPAWQVSEAQAVGHEPLTGVEGQFSTMHVNTPNRPAIPKMNFVMLTTGTWTEAVEPFVAIGLRLQADGHCVRIATNECFRQQVVDAGLEFYPLGGSSSTVRQFIEHQQRCQQKKQASKLFRLGFGQHDFPHLDELKAFVFSLWPACVDVDPLDPGLYFRADVILSHPFVLGHTIVAERLGVPLHCISTTPCSPTHAFPHLMSANAIVTRPYQYTAANAATYSAMDKALWKGMRHILDEFRSSIGLSGKSVRRSMLSEWQIPHTYLWNEALLEKPLDWGDEITIAGYVEYGGGGATVDAQTYNATLGSIQSFITEETTPMVFVGIDRRDWSRNRVEKLIAEFDVAAKQAGVRILFQTTGGGNDAGVNLHRSSVVLEITAGMPLAPVLPFVCSAMHYGDPSVTSICMAFGLPSCVLYRTITQRLWGLGLAQAGVGPEPIAMEMATTSALATALKLLRINPALGATAQGLARTVSSTVAVEKSVGSIYAHLPLQGMTCDLDPSRTARIYNPVHHLKLSYEAQLVVQSLAFGDPKPDLKYKPLQYSLNQMPCLSLRLLDLADKRQQSPATPSQSFAYDSYKVHKRSMVTAQFHSSSHSRAHAHAHAHGDGDVDADASSNIAEATVALKKKATQLKRYKSMAINVVDAPADWTNADVQHSRVRAINAAYERLLLTRQYEA